MPKLLDHALAVATLQGFLAAAAADAVSHHLSLTYAYVHVHVRMGASLDTCSFWSDADECKAVVGGGTY